ncbi:hypothetical protein [Blastococcus sp. SYSU DS0533]
MPAPHDRAPSPEAARRTVPSADRAGHAPRPVAHRPVERRPARLRVDRALLLCVPLLAAVVGGLAARGVPGRGLVVAGCLVLVTAFGAAFVWAGVSVAGFIAGAAGAGIVVAEPGHLLAVLVGAGVLALACGVAPGWERVEAWQDSRTNRSIRPPGAVSGSPAPSGNRWWRRWRTDRVLAAYLVLVFPPGTVAASAILLEWMSNR